MNGRLHQWLLILVSLMILMRTESFFVDITIVESAVAKGGAEKIRRFLSSLMDSSGFSSPRPDCFPAGLRVLVVDDDPTWLKILEKMLKKCNYEVVFLDNIWQHVFRKRIHEVRDIEGHESLEELQLMRSAAELLDDGCFFGPDLVPGKKRNDLDNKSDDPSNSKKARVVWTVDLHQKFVKAVNLIGFEKVGPKKILDLMGVPWLTRENVASHLQKYRLYLSRLQKENDMKDVAGNVCSKIPVSGHKIPVASEDPKICEGSVKASLSMPMTESKTALPVEMNDLAKSSSSSISFDHSFGPLNSDAISEPKIQVQYSWSAGAPPLQFKEQHKPHAGAPQVPFKHEQKAHGRVPPLQFKKEQKTVFSAEQQFDHFPPLPIHHIQVDSVDTSLNRGTERKESDKPKQAGMEPSYSKTSRSQHSEKVTKVKSTAALFSVQPESHLTVCHAIDPIPSSTWNTKSQSLEPNLFDDPESWHRNTLVGTGSALRLWEEGFSEYSPQADLYPPNPYLGTLDPFSFSNQDLITDVPSHLYDSLKFPIDPVEYHQGVYIA